MQPVLKLDRSGRSVWLPSNIPSCSPILTENTLLRSCCICLLTYSNSNFATFCPKLEPPWLFTDSFFLDWFGRGLCVRGHSAPSHPKPVPAEKTSDGRAGLPHPTAIMLHEPVPEEEKYSQQGEDQQPESPLEVQNACYDHQYEKRWKKCNTDMKLIG